MSISMTIQDNFVIIRPAGTRFDASVAPDFKSTIETAVGQEMNQFKIDLSEVNFVDSSGLGAIVSAYKLLHKDGSLSLYNVNDPVKDIFRLTSMDKVFDLSKTEDFSGHQHAA